MNTCKVCGEKIRIFGTIIHCNYCYENVHPQCGVIEPQPFDIYNIPIEVKKKLILNFSEIQIKRDGVFLELTACFPCFKKLNREIIAFIKNLKRKELEVLNEEKRIREEEIIRRENLMKQEIKRAKNYEIALKYNDAIEIYEKYEMWEDAGRCRKLQQQQNSPQTKVEIGEIDHSTKISDSVIQRSSIGRTPKKKIQICPYCGEELNFPETPRFCPYCRKQIIS